MAIGQKDVLQLWAWIIGSAVVLAVCTVSAMTWSCRLTSFWAQLVGSVLTLLGLLLAYMRARHPGETLRQQIQAFALRLIGKRREAPIPKGRASGTYAFRNGTIPDRGFRHRRDEDVQQQIDAIAEYLNNKVVAEFVTVVGRLDELKAATARAAGLADERSAEAYQRARADIKSLQRELDHSVALDLRWAIFGVYIATIGVAVGYWT